MRLSEVKMVLTSPLQMINEQFPCVKVYIFGSVLNGGERCGDIDILIIYNNAQAIAVLTKIFAEASTKLPFHFIWMTPSEEKELGFIEQQQAIDIQTAFSQYRMPNHRVVR